MHWFPDSLKDEADFGEIHSRRLALQTAAECWQPAVGSEISHDMFIVIFLYGSTLLDYWYWYIIEYSGSTVSPLIHTTLLLLPFDGPLSKVTRWASTRRNFHPLTPILIINHPLSASSIYYDPKHPPCSIYMSVSHFAPPLSKSSLVYILFWHSPLHTPYISSPNHCLLFAAHAHTNATCFAVVPTLCHVILVPLSTLYISHCHVINGCSLT